MDALKGLAASSEFMRDFMGFLPFRPSEWTLRT